MEKPLQLGNTACLLCIVEEGGQATADSWTGGRLSKFPQELSLLGSSVQAVNIVAVWDENCLRHLLHVLSTFPLGPGDKTCHFPEPTLGKTSLFPWVWGFSPWYGLSRVNNTQPLRSPLLPYSVRRTSEDVWNRRNYEILCMLFLTDRHILFVKFNLQIRQSRGLSMINNDKKELWS